MNLRPNDPVPPVTIIDLLSNTVGFPLVVGQAHRACSGHRTYGKQLRSGSVFRKSSSTRRRRKTRACPESIGLASPRRRALRNERRLQVGERPIEDPRGASSGDQRLAVHQVEV